MHGGAVRRGCGAVRRGCGAARLLQLLLASRGGVAPQPIEHRQVCALRRLTARLACDRLGHVLTRREEAGHLTKPRWTRGGRRQASEGHVAERAEEMEREEGRAGQGRRAAGVPRSSGRADRVGGSRRPHRPAA